MTGTLGPHSARASLWYGTGSHVTNAQRSAENNRTSGLRDIQIVCTRGDIMNYIFNVDL